MGERYLIREFSNHKQTGSVESFQEKFKELRSNQSYNPHLDEEYFISCYINRLKEEFIPFMNNAHPDTLAEAFAQAKLHERDMTIMHRRNKLVAKVSGGPPQPYNSLRAVFGTIHQNLT